MLTPIGIDCSPEAQDQRRRLLAELRAKAYSGISSVSDRSRSVGYHNPNYLLGLIRRLENELLVCTPPGFRSRSRIFYIPMVKAL